MNQSLIDDPDRLATLRELQLLDTEAESLFDEIVKLAACVCDTPFAAITLIDAKRQWFKAQVGLPFTETPLASSICAHTIASAEIYIVEDASLDGMHSNNPLVHGAPYLRAYAGVPLKMDNGHVIGALAVMDTRPRQFGQHLRDGLTVLARQVVMHIAMRRQKQELEQQARRLREAQRIADIGSWELDLASLYFNLSEQVCRIFGIDGLHDRSGRVNLNDFLRFVHPDDMPAVQQALDEARTGQLPMDLTHRIILPNGHLRFVRHQAQLIQLSHHGSVLAGTIQNVSDHVEKQALRELLEESIARVSDAVMITEAAPIDEPGPRIVFVNRAFEERTGYRSDEILGRSPRFLQGRDTQRSELDRVRAALIEEQSAEIEVINYTEHGKPFWTHMEIAPVAVRSEKTTHFVAIQRDVTQRKENEYRIEQLAFHDPLTKLPNRRLFMDRLAHAAEVAYRLGTGGAVMFIDLDNFKSLNDTLGHDKGDILLILAAERLQEYARKSNTVARLGGDEFVILLECLHPEIEKAVEQVRTLGEKILGAFQKPFDIEEHKHLCTLSIGVALFNGKPDNALNILKHADMAMYKVKSEGRNGMRIFEQLSASENQ